MTISRYIPHLLLRTFLAVLCVLGGCLIFSKPLSPIAKADTTCQGINVPNLALADGQPAQYTVYGVLCTNPSYSTYDQSVTLLVSGATFSHAYWDWPNTGGEYSWPYAYSAARYLAAAGFSTFNIDRIGVGQSSHPDSSLIDIPSDAYVLHELVGLLKAGAIGGISFGSVLLAGHALSSGMVLTEANTYQDVAGIIDTAFLHQLSSDAFGPGGVVQLQTANTDPSGNFSNLDSGYLTTVPDTRDAFYSGADSDPAMIQDDEETKQTVTQNEVNGLNDTLSSTSSSSITVPILIIVGQNDPVYCGSGGVDCSSNTSVLNEEAPYFSSQAQLQVAVIPNTGHCLNLEMTALQTFGTMEQWLAALYPPAGFTNPVANPSFETGDFSGWTTTGTTSTPTVVLPGNFFAQVGATYPTHDNSISQTFTAPSGASTLSFWYQVVCPDTVQYDWATATLTDNTSNTTSTILPNTCTNNGTWEQVTASVTAGDSYTLTLMNHDDDASGDPTYTLFDNIAFSEGATNPVVNPGFDTGDFTGWTRTGCSTSVKSTAPNNLAAQAGATTATNGDSTISQTFTVPSGASTLSFWYRVVCPDTVQNDWVTATLEDNTSNTTSTILPNTCTNNATWVQVTASVTAGDSYTVTLINHDDGNSSNPTYTFFDDVDVS